MHKGQRQRVVHDVMFRLFFKRLLKGCVFTHIYTTLVSFVQAQAEVFERTGKDSTISPVICNVLPETQRLAALHACWPS
jgi:hypothetical protein